MMVVVEIESKKQAGNIEHGGLVAKYTWKRAKFKKDVRPYLIGCVSQRGVRECEGVNRLSTVNRRSYPGFYDRCVTSVSDGHLILISKAKILTSQECKSALFVLKSGSGECAADGNNHQRFYYL